MREPRTLPERSTREDVEAHEGQQSLKSFPSLSTIARLFEEQKSRFRDSFPLPSPSGFLRLRVDC